LVLSITDARTPTVQLAASPSPPPAIDLRFAGRKRPGADAAVGKYGMDPRDPDAVPASDADFAASLAAGKVGTIVNLPQLEGALAAAENAGQLVVVKFVRDGCTACASTAKLYASAAKTYTEQAKFFEVDYDVAKPFCKQCKVRFVPSAHIYKGDTFLDAVPLGKNSWDNFSERLKQETA